MNRPMADGQTVGWVNGWVNSWDGVDGASPKIGNTTQFTITLVSHYFLEAGIMWTSYTIEF